MECVICKNGRTHKGKTTVTLERGGTIVIIKDVPAMICENCGEYYLDKKTTQEILKRAEESVQKGSEIEVINMKKVA
ncbi:MAG: type II toxin-antitoxin system MqsA family antitoxin [Bacteroidota bacterium]